MDDRDDLNLVQTRSVHDPVIAVEHLAKVFAAVFWDFAPGLRKGRQSLYRRDDTLNRQASVMGGVTRDEIRDDFQIA